MQRMISKLMVAVLMMASITVQASLVSIVQNNARTVVQGIARNPGWISLGAGALVSVAGLINFRRTLTSSMHKYAVTTYEKSREEQEMLLKLADQCNPKRLWDDTNRDLKYSAELSQNDAAQWSDKIDNMRYVTKPAKGNYKSLIQTIASNKTDAADAKAEIEELSSTTCGEIYRAYEMPAFEQKKTMKQRIKNQIKYATIGLAGMYAGIKLILNPYLNWPTYLYSSIR